MRRSDDVGRKGKPKGGGEGEGCNSVVRGPTLPLWDTIEHLEPLEDPIWVSSMV